MHAPSTTAYLLVGSLAACGGAAPSPAAPEADETAMPSPDGDDGGETSSAPTAAESPAAADDAAGLPTACADGSAEYCTPKPQFARQVCQGDFPTVALSLFSGSAPFTKGYLGRKTKAWSASGAGSSNEELPRDEEVVVLLHRGKPDLGGMQVSGASGGFEVMRWNGACVTLQEGELLFDPPPRPKIARIVWKRIEMDTRDALREDEKVNEAYLEHRKHCKGVSMGRVSLECVKADQRLGQAIADYVREGGKLPTPHQLP